MVEEYTGYGMTEEQARQFINSEGEFFRTLTQQSLQGEDGDMDEVRGEIARNFVMGLFFAALGSWAVIASSGKQKAKKQQEAQAVAPQPAAEIVPQFQEAPGNDGKTDSFT